MIHIDVTVPSYRRRSLARNEKSHHCSPTKLQLQQITTVGYPTNQSPIVTVRPYLSKTSFKRDLAKQGCQWNRRTNHRAISHQHNKHAPQTIRIHADLVLKRKNSDKELGKPPPVSSRFLINTKRTNPSHYCWIKPLSPEELTALITVTVNRFLQGTNNRGPLTAEEPLIASHGYSSSFLDIFFVNRVD